MSLLSKESKKVNWNKLQIRGAVANLHRVARDLRLSNEESISLSRAIQKLEGMLLNKLAEDYEAFKATELSERGKLVDSVTTKK